MLLKKLLKDKIDIALEQSHALNGTYLEMVANLKTEVTKAVLDFDTKLKQKDEKIKLLEQQLAKATQKYN
jgi:hypothetical protein